MKGGRYAGSTDPGRCRCRCPSTFSAPDREMNLQSRCSICIKGRLGEAWHTLSCRSPHLPVLEPWNFSSRDDEGLNEVVARPCHISARVSTGRIFSETSGVLILVICLLTATK